MDAAALIGIYIVISVIIQGIGFLISEAVDYEFPTAGLLTFLILFISAFWLAWPIAVRIFERVWGDRARRGETEEQATGRKAGRRIDSQIDLDRKPIKG
jgi:uncharacterized membrane protein YbhN (UPF0104 family)